MKVLRVFIVVVALVGFSSAMLFSQADAPKAGKAKGRPPAGQPFLSGLNAAEIENAISFLPPPLMARLAKQHGLTAVRGKNITQMASPKNAKERATYADRPVSAVDSAYETNASIAARPNNVNIVVAAFEERYGGYSWTSTSLDKGETWSAPKKLPPRVASDYVYTPVIRYSPNSAYLYAVYVSEDYYTHLPYIMISRSTNNGSSWSAPKVAFYPGDYDGDGYIDIPFRPRVDVHYFSTSTANPYVYITCNLQENDGGLRMLFRRSKDSASTVMSSYWYVTGGFLLGSRAIGGKNGDVLWFMTAASGFSTSLPFYILSLPSKDYGNTFTGMTSSVNLYYQPPYYLGPNSAYGFWFESMYPSVAMTSSGVAYLAVTVDPISGSATAEDGDIWMMKSPRPYTTWSMPIGLASGWGGQGFPSVRANKTASGTVLAVASEDHSQSYADNEFYDISMVYTGLTGGYNFARLTDIVSLTSFYWTQEYIDSSASASLTDKVIHVIWTDRADKLDYEDEEADVYCDLIDLIY